MIKRIAYTFLVLFGIVITVGFFRYNPTVIYAEKVPVSAETVVHVNLRQIEYNILLSFLKHPFSQFDSKESSTLKKEKKYSLFNQVEIPNSVFFYSNQQEFKGFLVSNKIPVKDAFVKAARQEGFTKEKVGGTTIYSKQRIACVVKNNAVQVILKIDKNAKISTEFLEAISEENYLSEDAPVFKNFKKNKSPIALSTIQGDFFKVFADGGQLRVKGGLNENNMVFLSFEALRNPHSIAVVSGKLNTKKLAKSLPESTHQKFKKLTTLSLDSIANKWNGAMEFNLSSFTEKSDTIVTYEYDDDFNKVEKKGVQKVITPNVTLALQGEELCDYLNKKEVMKRVENDTVLTLMPLLTTYSFCEGDKLQLTSSKEQNLHELEPSNKKFYLSFNVAQYQEKDRGTYSLINTFLNKVNTIKFSVAKNDEVLATVQLKNTSKNFFLQLLN